MVEWLREHRMYAELREVVGNATGADPVSEVTLQGEPALLRNEISALLTIMATLAALSDVESAGHRPDHLAGYSVGLWTAMHLAGMIDRDMLFRAVWARAQFMNETRAAKEGAMLAVIGVGRPAVELACSSVSEPVDPVWIANVNCPGQYSLAGTKTAIVAVRQRLEQDRPHKMIEVPVQGAWHCPLLDPAAISFRAWLDDVQFSPAKIPIMNDGVPLAGDTKELRDHLAGHIRGPVLWEDNVRAMVDLGISTLVEIGYGMVLTKFGFFINRSVKHLPWARLTGVSTATVSR